MSKACVNFIKTMAFAKEDTKTTTFARMPKIDVMIFYEKRINGDRYETLVKY